MMKSMTDCINCDDAKAANTLWPWVSVSYAREEAVA